MSIDQFWNMDANTFYQLLNNEREIIKQEQKEQEKQRLKSKGLKSPTVEDSKEYTDILEELENL